MRKIGLFFGSFNPIHNGHVGIAHRALDYVDQVWFVLAKQNPFKEPYEITDQQRFDLLRQSLSTYNDLLRRKCFVPINDEITHNLSGKTWDTLMFLEKEYNSKNDKEFYIICGDDVYFDIEDHWYMGSEIMSEFDFIVFRRNFPTADTLRHNATFVTVSGYDKISSSDIRNNIKNNDTIVGLVPSAAFKYIKEHNLYANATTT